jgi:NADP-dependent 3-hydroxy acid dehydrogenase YdfG
MTALDPGRTGSRRPGAAAILGVGPGLGLAIARRFGRAGHPIGLVSRTDARHQHYLDQLSGDGITAIAETADVLDSEQQAAALARIQQRLGPIEVLYFGPASMDSANLPVAIDRIDGNVVRDGLAMLPPAADAVATVLPDMLDRRRGAILLPTGLSAVRPMPALGQLALLSAAMRSYALTLNAAVADRGVYAGSLVIGGGVRGGDIYRAFAEQSSPADGIDQDQLAKTSLDPDDIADAAYQLTINRSEAEAVFSVLG